MRRSIVPSGWAVAVSAALLHPGASVFAQAPAPFVDVVLQPGEYDFRADAEAYLPFTGDGDGFGYATFRAGTSDGDGMVLGIGVGQRERLSGSFVLGGYALLDWYESAGESGVLRGTLGLELLTEDLTAHLNGYIAEGSVWEIDPLVATVVESGGTLQARITGTEGLALSGVDGGFGVRLPLDGLTGQDDELWLRLGGYHFTGSEVEDVTGLRLGGEWRAHDLPLLGEGSHLTIGAEAFLDESGDDDIRGVVSLYVPLQSVADAPVDRAGRLMTDPIQRRRELVIGERHIARTSDVVRAGGGSVGPVIYVENAGDGDGSFADPYDLATGIAMAGPDGVIVVLDSNGDIDVQGTLLPGQLLIGGGATIADHFMTTGGLFASFTPQGSVGTFTATTTTETTAAITADDRARLFGLSFNTSGQAIRVIGDDVRIEQSEIRYSMSSPLRYGIRAADVERLLIAGNTIQGTGTAVSLTDVHDALLRDNVIEFQGNSRFGVTVLRGTDIRIADNYIRIAGGNNSFAVFGRSSALSVTGNTIALDGTTNAGVWIRGDPMSIVHGAIIANNTFTMNSTVMGNINWFTIQVNHATGTVISGNMLAQSELTQYGMFLVNVDDTLVSGNTIISADSFSGGIITTRAVDFLTPSYNVVENNWIENTASGVNMGFTGGRVTGNTIIGSQRGVHVGQTANVTVSNNTIGAVSIAALSVSSNAIVSGTGNSWDGTGGGVQCSSFDGTGSGTVSFDGLPDCSFP